jgi:hypothetical protein
MVDAEGQWAEDARTHHKITDKILADDCQGTSPEGKRYTKSEEVADTSDLSKTARNCRLIDTAVIAAAATVFSAALVVLILLRVYLWIAMLIACVQQKRFWMGCNCSIWLLLGSSRYDLRRPLVESRD